MRQKHKQSFAHRKHTAKLLPHHHTSYHGLFVVVLVALFAAFFIGNRAQAADQIIVTATVPAPIPADPPTIGSPANGTVITQPSVTISGTCPVISPAIIIVIYEGNSPLGSQACSASGTYSIPIYLTPGSHTIVATVVTITDDRGGSSAPITITYNAPMTPTPAPNTGGGDTSVAPLKIIPRQLYIPFWKTRDAAWTGEFEGGIRPYSVTIFWGDRTIDKNKDVQTGLQTFRHHYDEFRNYNVRIELRDAAGNKTFIHVAAATTTSQLIPIIGPTRPLIGGLTMETLAIRLYFTMLLMIAILWIYEKYYKLRTQ